MRAIEALIKHFSVGYSAVVVYWMHGALDTALRSITGEQNVVGKNEWLRWNERRKAGELPVLRPLLPSRMISI